jgi:SCP-2 sterol transfer family protein
MTSTNGRTTQLIGLRACLEEFRARFQSNERAKKLAKAWKRQVQVEAMDTGQTYTMLVDDQQIHTIVEGPAPVGSDGYLVLVQGSTDTLEKVFSGRYNPSKALLDGMLSVFSNDRDKVKLEALALVIWGM